MSRGACQQSVIGYRIQKHRFSRSLCSLQTVYTIPVGCLVTNLSMTISNYREQVIAIAQLMRLDKPWGTVLLLWPTLWALWLASHGLPSLKVIAVFLLGGVIMRACGCVMNDWFDQDIDARVCRTKTRPIASGKIASRFALVIALVLACCAATLLLFLNRKTQWLAVCGLLLTMVYPTTKRWLRCPQLFLGITFAWGVPMAFGACGQTLDWACWVLYGATALWILGYDTIYAMQDLADDRQLPIHTMPKVLNGHIDRFIVVVYGSFWLIIGLYAYTITLRWPFFVCWVIAGYLLRKQLSIIKNNEKAVFLQAFQSNQWVGFWLWIGIVTAQ